MIIYSADKVAEIEGIEPNTLKVTLYRMKTDFPEWKCWKFQKFGKKWIATGIDDDLEICA